MIFEIFRKSSLKKASSPGEQPGLFLGRGGFSEYGHFDKRFMYGIQKNCLAGENFGVFSQYALKTAFLNES